GWLRENGFVWLRAFPSTLLDGEARPLFEQEDDWVVERAVAQLAWMRSLGHEGGLFVAVGARTA
ncbi:MAG: 2-polyprenyl-3-methyl-5-hydroxy-6-metoxy-1,4-benzoquinol methylase, partial [Deltaproteobacteria bacterium]